MDKNSEGWVSEKRWGDNIPVSVDQLEAMAAEMAINPEAYKIGPEQEIPPALMPDNLLDTINQLSGAGMAKLRSVLISSFGIRLESTGARALGAFSGIVMQTLDASPANPYEVTFSQHILDPFTGPGVFNLVERDADDDTNILDGESGSPVTIATKAGFSGITPVSGWSPFSKVITSDKIYSVVFVPGTAGDGMYSISARKITQDQ